MRSVVPGLLTRDECRATITAAETSGFEAMGARYPGAYRDNDRAVVDDAALAARLFERLSLHLPERWDEDGSVWRLLGLNSRFRFCRYRDGQAFTRHRDGAWSGAPGERSWLTVMLYLNDGGEFAGGGTRFYEGDDVVDVVAPREGQAIVFDHRSWHDGEAVRAGVKYVMRTDVMYRLDRAGSATHGEAGGGALRRERLLTGHRGYVWVVRALADGRLVSGSRDRTVRVWGTGEIVREGLESSAMALADVDGELWVGGRHGRIDAGDRGWVAHDGAVLALERAPDGSVLSGGADGRVRRWAASGELIAEVALHSGWVWDVAADGDAAVEPTTALAQGAKGDRNGTITLDDDRAWSAHGGAVTALARLAGDRLVSAGEDGAVRVWDGPGHMIGEGLHRDFVRSVAVIDATSFATGSYDGTVAVWRLQETTPGQ